MTRWIMHIDMNSYFASVEQQDNPALRGQPVGVGGKPGTRSILAAASREAKLLGVNTAMPAHAAIALCPQLIIVEPRYPRYQEVSERLFGILESFSPDLEIFSIDEAFLQIDCPSSDPQIVSSLISTALTIKERLRSELGPVLTASIGLAHGKRLAKLASESQKPDGLTVLLGDNESDLVNHFRRLSVRAFTRREFYAHADIEDLAGIGPHLGRRLRATGIHTLADLANRPLAELETLVFPYHKELFLIGQGNDPAPVVPYWRAKPEQSIGHQSTLPRDIPVIELPATIAWLAERVARRLRQAGFIAHELSLYFRRTHAPGWGSRHRTSRQLESDHDLYHTAWDLIRAAADNPGSGLGWSTPIRMPSLTVSGLVARSNATVSFLPSDTKSHLLTQAIDAIKDRFGDQSLSSGLSVGSHHHLIPDGHRKRFVPRLLSPS
ncbi:DNA polymerase IV [Candidatus Berkelbacteria bacterium]|nr:DNA polymerase IV [Candidatus Berkelbacteria bacterium]